MSEESLEEKVEERKLGGDGYVLIPAERVNDVRNLLEISGYVIDEYGSLIKEERGEIVLGSINSCGDVTLFYDSAHEGTLVMQLNLRKLLDVNNVSYKENCERVAAAGFIRDYANRLIELAKEVEASRES